MPSGRPFVVLLSFVCLVQTMEAADLERRTWNVHGVTREALVSLPAGAVARGGSSLVFAFHGHGGTMVQASRSFPLHQFWPDAIVVYPQGLPTPGALTDLEGKRPGWQGMAGGQGDRDLKFFDVMLASSTVITRSSPNCGRDSVNGFLSSLQSGQANALATPNLVAAQKVIDAAVKQVSTLRGRLGAFQKFTIGSTVNSLGVAFENASAAESAIRDTDFAAETSALTRSQILSQAATTILTQANASPQSALTLLRGA